MKRVVHLLWLLLFLITSCKSSIENRGFTVVEIINGNTIKLKNGMQIQLLGVDATQGSYEYLRDNVLNNKIRIRFDKQNDNKKQQLEKYVFAYITDNKNKCVNSVILELGLSGLNTFMLNDSLKRYAAYVDYQISSPKSSHSGSNQKRKDIQAIIRKVESSVFLVISNNRFDNTVAQGTGFFIEKGNLGVSNFHVFENGSKWYVKTSDDKVYKVKNIIKKSKKFDYVIFEVETNKSFTPIPKSDKLPEKGEDILVIGNPRGLENTVTRGIVSSIRSYRTNNDIIQIDAAISPGSSGSPVLNMYGEVIGIATMKIEDCENCNFAFSIKILGM